MDGNSRGLTRSDILSAPEALEEVRADVMRRRREMMTALQTNLRARVLLVGCGSSYAAARYGQAMIRRYTRLHATAIPCTDLLCFPELHLRDDLPLCVIFISRSGTTTETLLACERLRERPDTHLYSMTCDPQSALARLARPLIASAKAADAATAMTRSFLSFCYVFGWLAALHGPDEDLAEALERTPENLSKCLAEHEGDCETIAREPGIAQYVVLGGGPLYGIARDAATKFNELCGLPAMFMHPMEYIHGPISIASHSNMALLLASEGGVRYEEFVLHKLNTVRQPTAIVSASVASLIAGFRCLDVSPYARGNDYVSGLYYAPLVYLIAIHKALSMGQDPDDIKHLARALHLPSGK